MPLYLVERVFPDGFPIAVSEGGHAACIRIARRMGAINRLLPDPT